METIQKQTEEWYKKYYSKKGKDRNDILANPGVLFQTLAFQRSVIEALRTLPLHERESECWMLVAVMAGVCCRSLVSDLIQVVYMELTLFRRE